MVMLDVNHDVVKLLFQFLVIGLKGPRLFSIWIVHLSV